MTKDTQQQETITAEDILQDKENWRIIVRNCMHAARKGMYWQGYTERQNPDMWEELAQDAIVKHWLYDKDSPRQFADLSHALGSAYWFTFYHAADYAKKRIRVEGFYQKKDVLPLVVSVVNDRGDILDFGGECKGLASLQVREAIQELSDICQKLDIPDYSRIKGHLESYSLRSIGKATNIHHKRVGRHFDKIREELGRRVRIGK